MIQELNPKTPHEYLEALQRLIQYTITNYDSFKEGDGITLSDENDIQTLTDMFRMIIGCSQCALDCISNWHELEKSIK